MLRFVPFKFKLTLIISIILAILLAATYQFVKREIEQQFTARVHSDLTSTQSMIQTLLLDGFRKLTNATSAIAGHVFVKEILTDATMDQATRDDLIKEEVLFYFRDTVDLIVVAGSSGALLASTDVGKTIQDSLQETRGFINCMEQGEASVFFLFLNDVYYELAIEPYFLDEQMIGAICVGVEITRTALNRIEEVSGVDLAFLDNGHILLSTEWARDQTEHAASIRAFDSAIAEVVDFDQMVSASAPVIGDLNMAGERFLFFATPFRLDSANAADADARVDIVPTHIAGTNNEIATTYVLVKSLDKELRFLHQLLQNILLIGAVGIVIAICAGYLFSLKITRPIHALRDATREVENGNLNHRLHIVSRDEFMELGSAFNEMISGLAEKERVRSAMDKVVSREIASEMLKGEMQLGGEEKVATILFSDIRSFTTLSEGLSPTRLLQLLNRYFTLMSGCIDAHHGVIDKYIGDAIMALFGVPTTHYDDPYRAVMAALDMLEALQQFNEDSAASGSRTVDIGIGINTGKLVAGNMGAENRLNYTVLGDEVNLASRLEGLCKCYGVPIIISESTFRGLQNSDTAIRTRCLDTVQVKGKSSGIRVYELFPRTTAPPDVGELVHGFETARMLLLEGDVAGSTAAFRHLLERWPGDGPCEEFLRRCQRYREHPALVAEEYLNGVYIMAGK